MIEYQYKKNGAGNVYRKHKKKVECFHRGQWCDSIFPDVWDYEVLKPITKETALALTSPNS